MTYEKIYKRVLIDTLHPSDLPQKIEEAIQWLIDLKEAKEIEGFQEIRIESAGANDDFYWELTGVRLETDREFQKRIEKIEKEKQSELEERRKKEEKDRKEFERLKKKYG